MISHMNTWFFGRLASYRIALAAAILSISPALAATSGELRLTTPPVAAPEMGYKDDQNVAHNVKDNMGKLTAVHFWATWCVPCVKELSQVDAAQAQYGAKGFKVIAISLDGTNMDKVKKFLAEKQISNLAPYLDNRNMAFMSARIPGLPGTLFLDDKGQEVARVAGPLDWTSEATAKFIESHL